MIHLSLLKKLYPVSVGFAPVNASLVIKKNDRFNHIVSGKHRLPSRDTPTVAANKVARIIAENYHNRFAR